VKFPPTAVVAMADNGVIGRDNGLPWKLPDDLKRFKSITVLHTVLMGRRTFETLKHPLPDRHNLVLTRDRNWNAAGCTVVHSVDDAREAAGDSRLFVIGGAQVFLACWHFVNRIELTEVHADLDGDTRLRGFRRDEWIETFREEHAADARHTQAFSFVTLERR
jgi:dihydrofolate reductase